MRRSVFIGWFCGEGERLKFSRFPFLFHDVSARDDCVNIYCFLQSNLFT